MSAEPIFAADENLDSPEVGLKDAGIEPSGQGDVSPTSSSPTSTPGGAGGITTLCTNWGEEPVPDSKVVHLLPNPVGTGVGVRSLFDLEFPSCQDDNCLLGHRYLCRGGAVLLVGPTGIGKSAFVMQCAISWAVNRAAFGIVTHKALKVLLIQSENDDGDLAEMREGVLAGLNLSSEEREVARTNLRVLTEDSLAGGPFIMMLNRVLADEQPDLVIIDPAFAYIGASVTDQAAVTEFLRTGLTPLLRHHGCGAVVVHHTNKPPSGKEKPMWRAGDFAYAGGGTAEWGELA